MKFPPKSSKTVAVLQAIVALTIASLLWHPLKLLIAIVLLFPAIIPNLPIDPLVGVTSPPTIEHLTGAYPAGTVTLDLYHPATGAHNGALLFLLGAAPVELDDPMVVRFASALAREGIVVGVPTTTGLRNGTLTTAELAAIQWSWQQLRNDPLVDVHRTGIFSLSVAGGLSLVAAEQPPLQDEVRFITTLGSYADLFETLLDITSDTQVRNGLEIPWNAAPLAHLVAERTLDALPDANDPSVAERIQQLEAGGSRAEMRQLILGLPPAFLQDLALLSPRFHLGDLHARVTALHDVDDVFISVSQQDLLREAAPQGAPIQTTTLSIFDHVVPDRPTDPWTYLTDLWALAWAVGGVLNEVI